MSKSTIQETVGKISKIETIESISTRDIPERLYRDFWHKQNEIIDKINLLIERENSKQ